MLAQVTDGDGAVVTYTYSVAGDVIGIHRPGSDTRQVYDAGRLAWVRHSQDESALEVYRYNYDSNGNRLLAEENGYRTFMPFMACDVCDPPPRPQRQRRAVGCRAIRTPHRPPIPTRRRPPPSRGCGSASWTS